jgi:hypothetical protein
MALISSAGTRILAALIEQGVLVPMKKDRIVELFTDEKGEARCTCTSCGDGDRIGRKLDRLYDVSQSRKVHLFTDNGGPLAHCDDSPLLVIDGWSNESVYRQFRQIEKAQKKLDKGKTHASITHFPCGAAKEVGFNEVEQLQMFSRALCFKREHLDVDPEHLVALVHIEWSCESREVILDEFPHLLRDRLICDLDECLLFFKRSAWAKYCTNVGIPTELDVHEYNLKQFGRTVSASPQLGNHPLAKSKELVAA